MNYNTEEFTDDFSEFLDSMSDDEFESFLDDISKCTDRYNEGTMLERLIREGNWWDSLMDVYYRDSHG